MIQFMYTTKADVKKRKKQTLNPLQPHVQPHRFESLGTVLHKTKTVVVLQPVPTGFNHHFDNRHADDKMKLRRDGSSGPRVTCAIVTLGIIMCYLTLSNLSLLTEMEPYENESGSIGSNTHPEFILVITSHKTGTALTGCLFEAIQRVAASYCHQKIPIDYFNDHSLLDASFWTGQYIALMGRSSSLRQGAHRSTRSTTQASIKHRASQPRPLAIFRTGYPPQMICIDQGIVSRRSRQCTPLAPTGGGGRRIVRASMVNIGCPCMNGRLNCSSIGHCDFAKSNPASQRSRAKRARIDVILVVRRPIDVVLSAYAYHRQEPPVEEWLDRDKFKSYVRLFEMSGGFPFSLTADIEGHDRKWAELSYHAYLSRQDERKGLLAEFMHSSLSLWQLARARSLAIKSGRARVVRYEDLQRDPATTLEPFLLSSLSSCLNATLVNVTLVEESKVCNLNTWSSELRSKNSHVTHNATVNQRRAAILLESPYVKAELARLDLALGYQE